MRELKCFTKYTDTAPIHGPEKLFEQQMDQKGIAVEYKNALIEVAPGEFWTPDFYLPSYDCYVSVAAGAKARRHAQMAIALYVGDFKIYHFDRIALYKILQSSGEFPFESLPTREAADGERGEII